MIPSMRKARKDKMKKKNEILALREGFYATSDEIKRMLAKEWGCEISDGIAVLSVVGTLGYESYWGAGTYTSLRAKVEALLLNDDVSKIVLDINSPGGDVNGLFECCEYLAKAKEQKPIHVHVTGMCCSAAYAIAVSCTDITATQTSEIGSIGVYASAYDDSEYMKKEGILSKIFRSKNAENKNMSAFTDEGAKDIQDKIDFYEDCFYTVISENRGLDRGKCIDTFGHGSVFLAEEALSRGMIDKVSSYDEFIKSLSSSEDEEEKGESMDIASMNAEQKSELFNALIQDSPELLAEVQKGAKDEERARICRLNEQRSADNAGIIDKAISEGSTLEAIALDLYKAERARKDNALSGIANQAENTQDLDGLQNPNLDDMGAKARRIAEAVNAIRK